jgi:hypothetical protein
MDFFERKLPIVISGRFWLADEPALVAPGKVTIESGHLYDFEMDVPTQFANTGRFAEQNLLLAKHDAILGKDRDGNAISLLTCTSLGSDMTYSARQTIVSQTARFFAECVMIGTHISNLDAVKFTDFHAFFTGFTAWAGGVRQEQWSEFFSDHINRADEIENFGAITVFCGGRNRHALGDFEERSLVRYLEPRFRPASSLYFREMTSCTNVLTQISTLPKAC